MSDQIAMEASTASNMAVPSFAEIEAAIKRATKIPASYWRFQPHPTSTHLVYLGAHRFPTWVLSRMLRLESAVARMSHAYVLHCGRWPYPRYRVKGRREKRKRRRERRLWSRALMACLREGPVAVHRNRERLQGRS